MEDFTGKTVVCKEPVIFPNKVFLKMGQPYHVFEERKGFVLVHYTTMPQLGPIKGWWSKSRFQYIPEVSNGE